MVITVVVAALARAGGVDFELPEGSGETIPSSGFAFVTGVFSVVGVVIAATLLRWSARPDERFVQVAVTLTAVSLAPPLLSDGDTATILALLLLHLVAASVMIPSLAWSLRPSSEDGTPAP
jgi:predicted MFS family arabinose efflux permease